jgi:hypothetical protein
MPQGTVLGTAGNAQQMGVRALPCHAISEDTNAFNVYSVWIRGIAANSDRTAAAYRMTALTGTENAAGSSWQY